MNIAVEEKDAYTRVGLAGKLDVRGAEAIEIKFILATKNRERVVVDLTELEYIASMGIRLLVMAGKASALRGGKIVMVGANDAVAKVITTAGIDEIVPMVADWAGVQASFA
jgi:anti-sigma B factor antagonist